MAGLRQIWISLFLIALFTLACLTFAFKFISTNDSNNAILNDSAFNNTFRNLNSSLSALQLQTTQEKNATEGAKGNTISLFLILDYFLFVPWHLINFGISIFGIVQDFIFFQIFGGNFYVVFATLTGLLTGTIIFLVIKFIRTGESER